MHGTGLRAHIMGLEYDKEPEAAQLSPKVKSENPKPCCPP